MKANIKKTGDTTVVSLSGTIDFETHQNMKQDLTKLINRNKTDTVPKKIIFDMKKLEFVGSSGITHFIQTLKDFSSQVSEKPKYCNVQSEFQQVIKAFDDEEIFEFHDTEEKAKKSFDN